MKKLKRLLALVIAMAMVLSMSVAAFADDPATAATKGTITVNSPIMGAQYFGYKVFDLEMDDNNNPTAFSYTIDTESPFYKAVASYAAANPTELKLDEIKSETVTTTGDNPTITYQKFNIDGKTLDAQKFGKWLRDRLATNYTDEDKIENATAKTPTYETGKTEVTVAKAEAITFENLDWGYYLITNNYDDPTNRVSVTVDNGKEESDADYKNWTFNKEDTAATILEKATAYAQDKYPDLAAAQKYVQDNPSFFDKTWDQMKDAEKNKVLTDLQTSTRDDLIDKVNNALAAAASDDNAQTINERFVFVDSTAPNAIINEKNELNKWDVPVNPDGHAELEYLPEHDEPKGGKNIIVGETKDGKSVYADSTETNIGDKVHYQLSVNAVNFERDLKGDDNATTNGEVRQIKEYVIADYQNKNMEFDEEKGLKVSIIKKDKDGKYDTSDPTAFLVKDADYTEWVKKGYFFTNKNKEDLTTGDVFSYKDGDNEVQRGGGIVIPWVYEVTKDTTPSIDNLSDIPNVQANTVFTKGAAVAEGTTFDEETMFVADDGKTYMKVLVYREATDAEIAAGTFVEENGVKYATENGQKVQAKDKNGANIYATETHYFASLYPNDVTILVDYYMTLTDTAVIDGDGNINYSQFGVNYLDKEDRSYEPDEPNSPPDEPKNPEEKKEKDDATVFTYAVAIKKVDNDGNTLAGAEFQMRGVKAEAKSKGWYKVTEYNHSAANFDGATTLETDDNGILVVEGLPQKWAVEVLETKAPKGFNKLTDTKEIKPIKTGSEMTTTSKVTYTDVDGNVTEVSTTTVTYKDASDAVIAKSVKTGDDYKYYDGDGNLLTDDKVGDTVTKSAKDKFDELIANKYKAVNETDVTKPANIAELEIVNQKGTELPSTGGIGTTIFYVVGAILVIGAGVVLITKRRMDA